MDRNPLLRRIAGLLRQAESTDNEHEADAFFKQAQRLATQSSIDLAVARAYTADRERRLAPIMREIVIGARGKRGLRTYVQLFLRIAQANDVRCDVASNSTRVYGFGFDTDIDLCQALYSALVVQMVRASDAYLKTGQHRRTIDGHPPVAGVTARLNFQLAFARRVGSRLAAARAETRAAAESARTPAESADTTATGTALALRAKDLDIADFYTKTSTARGHWRGAQSRSQPAPLATRAGDRAGMTARLGLAPELPAAACQLTA